MFENLDRLVHTQEKKKWKRMNLFNINISEFKLRFILAQKKA